MKKLLLEDKMRLDSRKLNKQLSSDHEMPLGVDEVLQKSSNVKIFSSLDLSTVFWQPPLCENSKKYTVFMIDGHTFVFNVVAFGLKSAYIKFLSHHLY